ncbi:MAG: hypothetical protein OEZ58_22140, partial [Gammaproteobacteria bacterium]|nr:hypothetical protein [Gammaproteobacteria bacterium]
KQTSATLYFYDGTQELILDKATLSIKAKGIAQTMLKHDSRSTKSYSASFDFSNTNEMFTLSIFRADYEDAPNTFVTGPSPVVINSPLDQSTQDGNAAYELQWSPSIEGESLDYWTLIYCQHPTNGITEWKASRDEKLIPDTGTYTIDFSAWFIQESIAPEWQCNAQTWLARETQGTLDPALNPNGNAIARYFHVISYDISH